MLIKASLCSFRIFSKVILLSFLSLLVACQSDSPEEPNPPAIIQASIPVDENILQGRLDNGIGYLIRENKKPENFAELRLVLKVGSLNEDEQQLGFAHFVEHMAFNGTEDFKEQEIIAFVESIGMRFGAHLNASTGFDSTIYKLRVPSDDPKIIETAIKILENWAHKVSFEAQSIDEERGVVLEEWRGRKGVGERLSRKQWPIVFAGTDYPERLPIGTEQNITQGRHQDLVRFYHTWYHPELMSVVAVGDFQKDTIQALIERYFGNMSSKGAAPKIKEQNLLAYKEPQFHSFTDKELSSIGLSISWRHNQKPPIYDLTHYKQSVIKNIASSIIAKRLSDLTLDTQSAFTSARLSYGQLLPSAEQVALQASIKPERVEEALYSLLQEMKRAAEHGVSAVEFEKEKDLYIEWFESAIASQNTLSHNTYVNSYIQHVLRGTNLTSIEQDFELSSSFLKEISLDDIHEQLGRWFNTKNAVIFFTAPDNMANQLLSNDALAQIWSKANQSPTQAIQDKQATTTLLLQTPVAGSVVAKKPVNEFDADEWTLSNGIKVIVKKTNFKENQILFSATSEGGFAMVADESYLSSFGMMSTINFLGLGHLDMQAFQQFSREQQFTLNTSVNKYSESMRGRTNIEDLELLMQSIYLRFTAPVKDQERFDWLKSNYRPSLENKYNRPEAQFQKLIKEKTKAGDPRIVEFDLDILARQNLDTIFEIYKQRFANPADFSFVFVGDFDLDKMEDFASLYLASLPTNNTRESRKKLPHYPLKGDIQVHMEKGDEPKATVIYSMFGEAKWTYKQQQTMAALQYVLDNKLRNKLREELGGVYSVRVNTGLVRWPYQEYKVNISFTCDPQRIDELKQAMLVVFAALKDGKIDESLIENYKTQALSSRNKNLRENNFWMSYILSYYSSNPAIAISEYEKLVKDISTEDLINAAKLFLQKENRIFASLKPKVKEAEIRDPKAREKK